MHSTNNWGHEAWERALAAEWVCFRSLALFGDFNWAGWRDELHAYAMEHLRDALVAVQNGWGDRAVLPFIIEAYTLEKDVTVPDVLLNAAKPDPARDAELADYLQQCGDAWESRDYDDEDRYYSSGTHDDHHRYVGGGDREEDDVIDNAPFMKTNWLNGDYFMAEKDVIA